MNKVGLHLGIGGNQNGSGQYMSELLSNGVPAVIKSADNYGPVYELITKADQYNAPFVAVFRWSAGGYDLPDYNKSPKDAATEHWGRIKGKIAETPEFDKRTWLEVINEPDKNRSEWLADFCLEIGKMMTSEGYKPALLSWSSGEPEPDNWEGSRMLALLSWVAGRSDVAIALHEYDYAMTGMSSTYPWHIGRYKAMLDVCTANSIPIESMKVIISEWGWAYNDIPQEDSALNDIQWAGDLYASDRNVLGAALWVMADGWGNIDDKVSALIPSIIPKCLDWGSGEYPPDPPDPPDDTVVLEEYFDTMNESGDEWYNDGNRQIRTGWVLEMATGSNPLGNSDGMGSDWMPFEALFLWDAFLPEDEWDRFLNERGFCYKTFSERRPWGGRWYPDEKLPAGRYMIELEYVDDCYDSDTGKEPPADPLSFESCIGMGDDWPGFNNEGWIPSLFQEANKISMEIEIDEPARPWFALRARWGIKNPGVFVQHFTVTALSEPEPEPGCSDSPRVPYKRTYFVARQDVSLQRFLQIAEQAYYNKNTVGFSHDDAGYGLGLEEKNVVVFDESNEQEFLDWYAEHYPCANVRFDGGSDDFSFTHWPTEYKIINQGFGENPDYYGQFGLPGHEGVDIKATRRSGIFSAFNGTVSDIRTNPSGHNYGIFVRVSSGKYEATYAHLDQVADGLSVGTSVNGGQLIGYADNTGNSNGDHLHLTLKHSDAHEGGSRYEGYPYNIINPEPYLDPLIDQPPPPSGDPATLGVHMSARGSMEPGELAVVASVSPRAVKILSSMSPQDIGEIKTSINPSMWVVRAFLDFGGRAITPQQFYDYTISDVQRSIDEIGSSDVWVELHNEPNLAQEGMWTSWQNGYDFGVWISEVARLYSNTGAKTIFPGLSPGGSIPDIRSDSIAFLSQCSIAARSMDAVGLHTYWAQDFSVQQVIDQVNAAHSVAMADTYIITEASNNKPYDFYQKGIQYVEFLTQITQSDANITDVFYFVASASPNTFDDEIWVSNGQSTGIAEGIRSRYE